MTEEKIKEIKTELEDNKLYCSSTSPFKKCQYLQFLSQGIPLSGEHVKKTFIKEKEVPVIYRFDENGLIHSDSLPAVEYLGHWEYWKHGLLEKVVDKASSTVELWSAGYPLSIGKIENTGDL